MKTLYTNKRIVLVIVGIVIGILSTIALAHDMKSGHLAGRRLSHLIHASRGYVTNLVETTLASI